jgi:hypothetical protein
MEDISLLSASGPALLTAVEAATIARCSIKTVRRAYATGALTAYRRRGSRAVLLDSEDVLAWAQGQLVEPTAAATSAMDAAPAKRRGRRRMRRVDRDTRAPKLGTQLRFDVSVEGLGKRRSLRADTRPAGT